jgi:hypothetical protein
MMALLHDAKNKP